MVVFSLVLMLHQNQNYPLKGGGGPPVGGGMAVQLVYILRSIDKVLASKDEPPPVSVGWLEIKLLSPPTTAI